MLDVEDARHLRKLVQADIDLMIEKGAKHSTYGYEVALKWRKALLKKLEMLSK